jgi:TetR/AcrR family transcriptional regulator
VLTECAILVKVSASQSQQRILDAAYTCFTRHGVRKTTMDDIAAAAGLSRPAVYQYVRNKDDAFRRVVARIYDAALARARAAALGDGTLTQRLDRALTEKLGLNQQLPGTLADLEQAFHDELAALLAETIVDAAAGADLQLGDGNAREVAELALALTRGLEADAADPQRMRERLRNGLALLVAGLAAATQVPGRRP